jgi:hypothetical protein
LKNINIQRLLRKDTNKVTEDKSGSLEIYKAIKTIETTKAAADYNDVDKFAALMLVE